MKLAYIIGLYCIAGLRQPTGDRLLQKQKDLDKFRFPLDRHGNGMRREIPANKRFVVSPQGNFEFVISSSEDSASVSKLITALQVSSGFLENAITFSKRIKVNVEHGTYCSQASCNRGEALGKCKPNLQVIGKDGSRIAYPYSLVKQGGFEPEPDRSFEFDMEVYLKNSPTFVYPDQYGSHEIDMKTDITEIIIHELIHGLGIVSSISTYSLGNSVGYTGPGVNYTSYYKDVHAQFIPTNYDTHLYYDKSRPLQELIRSMDYRGIDRDFLAKIKDMPQIHTIDRLIHQPNSTFFQTSRNSRVFIETNLPRGQSGSSINHLDKKSYQTSQNFLMGHAASTYAYLILQSKLTRGWLTAPMGNHIIEVLETLGYQRNPSPQRERSQLALYEAMRNYNFKRGVPLYFHQPVLI